ncbi:hypothetical protein CN354_06755 [Bacillus cereus]|nr:hypothetical protein CN354_06755 [Bacillus cereus]WJE51502.1 DUF1129 domain-containing protein [Bacillus cereus]
MQVSKEGEKFLIDMKVYLLMKGRKEDDIESFLEDAELHLIEGEKQGKTVEDIFGDSPEVYAEELAKEMELDKKENMNLFISFIIGVLAYWSVPDLLFHGVNEPVSTSLISLIGYPIVLAVSIPMGIIAFRKSAFITSKLKEFSILYICISLLPVALIVLVMLLNKWYEPPLFYLSSMQSYLLGGLLLCVLAIINMRLARWMGLLQVAVLFTIMFAFECTAIKDTNFGALEPLFLYGSLIVLMKIDLKRTNTSNV